MPLKVLDADGNTQNLSIRKSVTSTRNSEIGGQFDGGIISQTDIHSLPKEIEDAINHLASLIETIKTKDSLHSSVDRVKSPDKVKSGNESFTNPGVLPIVDTQLFNPSEGKTMAYCDFKASSSNEGPIYIGSSDTSLNEDTGREVDPGEPVAITIDDLTKVSVYSPSPGNSFSYIVYHE